jgi:Icc-related predicted phosphoesterase
MKVLIVSDGHGALDKLDLLEPAARAADLVLYGGDFARYGSPETGRPFLERLSSIHDRIFAVIGNCDEPDFRDDLEEFDMSIEGSLSFFNGLVLSGSGGGSKFSGTTPNERSDEELASDLRLVAASADGADADSGALWDNLVVIAHNPPKDTKLDAIPNGVHVGSPLIRAFIETHKPLLVVSGHIHESAAIDRIGGSTLVNPGALAEGKYAIAEISGGGKVPFAVASIELKSLD